MSRDLCLMDVLFDKVVPSAFIPSDVLDRIYFHFGIRAVVSGEGRKLIFRNSFVGADSLTKKARNYLDNLLTPDKAHLGHLDISDEWFQVLKSNIGVLTAIETEFSVVIFPEKKQFFNSNMTVTNVDILKEMLQTPVTSDIYRQLTRHDVETFLYNRPSASLISMLPVREEFRLAFVYHAKRLMLHELNSESITSRIHDDLELHVVLPSLPPVTISCVTSPLESYSNWIPSDLFYRTHFLHGQTFFLLSTKSQTLSIAYRASSPPTQLSLVYHKNLLQWSPQGMKTIPSTWCEALSLPGFLYKLERFLGVELIFDPDRKSLFIQGHSRETLFNRLFTEAHYDKTKNLDIDVCDGLLLSHNLATKKDLSAFPDVVKQTIAYFLQGFLEMINVHRNRSHWQSVNPQSESVIDLDSSDDDDVVMVSGSPNRSSSPEGSVVTGDIEALKRMTPSMRSKLLRKTEKALCFGFLICDVIDVIIEKGAHKAALLSENAFLSLVCDKQLASNTNKNLARPLSDLESRLKKNFSENYPSTSLNMSEAEIEERANLLFLLITDLLEKRKSTVIERSTSGEVGNAAKPGSVDKGLSPAKKSSSPQVPKKVLFQPAAACLNNSNGFNQQHQAKENVCSKLPQVSGFGRGRPIQNPIGQSNSTPNYAGPPTTANYTGPPTTTNYTGPPTNVNYTSPLTAASYVNASSAANYDNAPSAGNYGNASSASNYENASSAGNFACALPRAPLLPTPNMANNHVQGAHTADHTPIFRPVVIDGSNVSFECGKQKMFDTKGLQAAVERFREIGCEQIFILVPRKRMSEDRFGIMEDLQKQNILSFTPSRKVYIESLGREVTQTPYDDRIILQSAMEYDGVVVSNDQYRDLKREDRRFDAFINDRLLMYTFVGDKLYLADDPFGPSGPSLMELLCKVCGNMRQQRRNFGPTTNFPPSQRQRSNEQTRFLMSELLKVLPNDKPRIERLLQSDLVSTDLNNLVVKLL